MPHEGETRTWLETEHGDEIVIQGLCSIGRAESNNIILNKGVVSRQHAVIHERDKAYWIVDLGGVNGVLLNGTRVIQSARLQSGDTIQIPSADFIFHHKSVPAGAPIAPPAPVSPKPTPPLEPPRDVTSLPMSASSLFDTSTPSDVTVPLPNLIKPAPQPAKPTAQEELPLGLPPEVERPTTGKLKKPRVYVGPMDTRGLPRVTLPKSPQPEEIKPALVAAKPTSTATLPKSSEDSLKVTIPLSPATPAEKPKEMLLINAPDVVVPSVEKPKSPPVLPPTTVSRADSLHEPSRAQVAASGTKSVALPKRPKTVNFDPVAEPLPASFVTPVEKAPVATAKAVSLPAPPSPKEVVLIAKPAAFPTPARIEEKEESFSSIVSPPRMLPSTEVKERKKIVPKGSAPTPAKKVEAHAKPELAPIVELAAKDTLPAKKACPAAKQSQYVGLASIFLPFIGVLPALAAIVLGHSALKKIKQSNGTLAGRDSAVMGLYFGYISLVFISGYSILFYMLDPFSLRSEPVAHSLSTPAPLVITPETPSPAPSPTAVESTPTPASSPAIPAASPDTSVPAPRVSSADLQVAPTPMPEAPPPTPAPAPEVTNAPSSETPAPATRTTTTATWVMPSVDHPSAAPTPPSAPPDVPAPVATPTPPSTPPSAMSDGTRENVAAPLQNNTPLPSTTNTAPTPAAAVIPPATPPGIPAVYNAEVQNKLKDGMLAQPMPEDTTSRAYMDAESFNNCARILARPPEAKYAESVGDFLDDVKTRNPDPARLQILSTMYENYMAGIKRDY